MSLPPVENEELIRHELTTNKVGGPVSAEAPKADPGAPDPVEVLLNEINVSDTTEAIDLLSKRVMEVCPKGHPLRQQIGAAINAARKRVK